MRGIALNMLCSLSKYRRQVVSALAPAVEKEAEEEALTQVISTPAFEVQITKPAFDSQNSTAPVLKRKRGRPAKNISNKKARTEE